MEGSAHAGEDGGEEDVGDEGHDGYVHIGGVDVVARGQVVEGLGLGLHLGPGWVGRA